MYRMYGHRAFELVTVSINYPDEKPGVLSVLTKLHATTENLLLGSTEIYDLLAAFDPTGTRRPLHHADPPGWGSRLQASGTIDPLEVRRMIIANLKDDDYIGHQAYWKTDSAK